ncbi:MAG: molybdenum cofactor guanylyltransferase [Flavisolibacter sp.]|nr:molybdenum cofactor guanylyltransferase [Flavisolibacter sp.]
MTGVVLCGGQSSRMGTDKGLLQQASSGWAQVATEKLSFLQIPIAVSVNQQQYPFYKNTFKHLSLIEDNPLLSVGGPLKGILSVHIQMAQEDLLVLACDMPSMQIEVLQHLLSTSKIRNEEAFVFKNRNTIEPLCSIYTAKGLNKILQLYQQGEIKRFSMQHAVSCLQTYFLPVPPQWEYCFTNYNTPEDLKGLCF